MNVPIIGHPSGTTRALNEVTIRARVKGFLKEKNFVEGSTVKKGDLLLVIDEEPFKVKVAQAKAVLEEAEAALRKARESKAKEVAKAKVDLDADPARARPGGGAAGAQPARAEGHLAGGLRSGQDPVSKSAAQVEAANAALQQSTADYEINILTAQAKIDQAKADLEAAQIDLGYCRMFAPIDGRTGELQVKLGNLVGPGGRVQRYHVAGLDPAARSHGRRYPAGLALSAPDQPSWSRTVSR